MSPSSSEETELEVRTTVDNESISDPVRNVTARDVEEPETARAEAQAAFLKVYRERAAITQATLGRLSGVSRPIIAALERGEGFSSMKVRRKLAAYFGIDPDVLLLVGPGEDHEERLRNLASAMPLPDTRARDYSRESGAWPGVRGGSRRGKGSSTS